MDHDLACSIELLNTWEVVRVTALTLRLFKLSQPPAGSITRRSVQNHDPFVKYVSTKSYFPSWIIPRAAGCAYKDHALSYLSEFIYNWAVCSR